MIMTKSNIPFGYFIKVVFNDGNRGVLRKKTDNEGNMFTPTKEVKLLKMYAKPKAANKRAEDIAYDFESKDIHGCLEVKAITPQDTDDFGKIMIGRIWGTDNVVNFIRF